MNINVDDIIDIIISVDINDKHKYYTMISPTASSMTGIITHINEHQRHQQ